MVHAPFNRCVECDDIITNPLCANCLASRMAVTVGEYDTELAKDIHGCNIEGETQCISCGQKMGLCAHCFSKDMYDFLAERNPKVARVVLSQFDYHLRRALI